MNCIGFFGIGISTFGIYYNSFALLVLGRFIQGISSEGLFVAQIVIGEQWFMGTLLSISLGVRVFLTFLSNSFESFFLPYIFIKTRNLVYPFFSMTICMFLAVVLNSFIPIIDLFYNPKALKNVKQMDQVSNTEVDSNINGPISLTENMSQKDTLLSKFKDKDTKILGQSTISLSTKNNLQLKFTLFDFRMLDIRFWLPICIYS